MPGHMYVWTLLVNKNKFAGTEQHLGVTSPNCRLPLDLDGLRRTSASSWNTSHHSHAHVGIRIGGHCCCVRHWHVRLCFCDVCLGHRGLGICRNQRRHWHTGTFNSSSLSLNFRTSRLGLFVFCLIALGLSLLFFLFLFELPLLTLFVLFSGLGLQVIDRK